MHYLTQEVLRKLDLSGILSEVDVSDADTTSDDSSTFSVVLCIYLD